MPEDCLNLRLSYFVQIIVKPHPQALWQNYEKGQIVPLTDCQLYCSELHFLRGETWWTVQNGGIVQNCTTLKLANTFYIDPRVSPTS